MTPLDVAVDDLTVAFRDVTALDALTLDLAPGRIHGLLGRNGAGKTTLLSVLASFRRATAGTVRVGGRDPWENAEIVRRVCFVHEGTTSGDELGTVSDLLATAAALRPTWNAELARELVAGFELPDRRVGRLSLGQRSAVGVVLGLASRAPLTLFDESHLGMDAPSRELFSEALLADYLAHPRTIVISTHLVDEAANLFEDVAILDRGRLLLQGSADDLRTRGVTVTGPAERVASVTAGGPVLREQRLGPTVVATVDTAADSAAGSDLRQRALAADLEVGAISLQDLFVNLTRTHEEP